MSEKGQKRRSKSLPATSDLPPSTDIIRPLRLVRLVQKWRSRELQMQHSLTAKHLLPHKRRRKFARRANQQNLSSPLCKNISLNPSGKSPLETRPSHPNRGGSRVVTNARWDAMDATASGAQGVAGRVSRERSTGVRTDGAAAHLRRNLSDGTRSGKTFGGDGRGRRSRVVLAPEAGVKFCGDVSTRPGPDASVIRRATVAKELGSPRRARSKP
jgi:hypothetical protein